MINQSRYRLFLMISSILATLSVAMFIYQHFFYEERRLKDLVSVYIVASPVDAHEVITPGDLKELKIPQQALIDGMVTNLSTLNEIPHYTLHSLKKGEILVESQLTTENLHNEGTLLVPLTGNYVSEITAGDMVSFYTLAPDIIEDNGHQYSVSKLFSAKKVYANGRLDVVDAIVEGGESSQYYIKVTEEEMNAYYQALKTSEIIVAKHMIDIHAVIDSLDHFEIEHFDDLLKPQSESTDSQTPDVKPNGNNLNNNSIGNENSSSQNNLIGTINPPLSTDKEETTPEDDRSTVLYRVGEDDTWETIAMKFKTDKNTLYKLNPNVLTLRKGTELLVPSI